MRIRLRDAAALWLAGAAMVKGDDTDGALSSGDGGAGSGDYITFGDFSGSISRAAAIFVPDTDKTFTWTSTQSITVTEVAIFQLNDQSVRLASGKPVVLPSFTPPSTTNFRREIQIEALLEDSDIVGKAALANEVPLTVTTEQPGGNGRNGTIVIPQSSMAALFNEAKNQPLFFEIFWQLEGVPGGQSFSRVFAISSRDDSTALLSDFQYRNTSAVHEENRPPNADGIGSSASDSGGSNGLPGTTSGAPTATATPSGSLINGGGPASEGSSGSGLAVGAKVGIAVACSLVGLALIGALVWFILRRSRRRAGSKLEDPDYPVSSSMGYANGRPDHLADKEAHAGVEPGAPHSPYSEDGPTTTTTTAGVGGMAGVDQPVRSDEHHHRSERQFSPYTDAAPPADRGAVRSVVEPDNASSTRAAAGGPSTVAHLIEEGMSPEDIARLEAEERHLDAAIERAGRS